MTTTNGTMNSLLKDREETIVPTPHLSYSRLSKYLLCPEQYRLYYVENWRPRIPSASLVFGQIIHQALAVLFQRQGDPVKFFQTIWEQVKKIDLNYNQRESWEKLNTIGPILLGKFVQEEFPKLGQVQGIEQPFELTITNLVLPFVGVVDLKAELEGRPTVIDFKTSASSYDTHEVLLSDQLTAYQLAAPEAQQLALCVFVKNKKPKIEWHIAKRNGRQLTEFLAKAGLISGDIRQNRFYKRPGRRCGWCDYLPICLGDKKKAQETLIQTA